MTENTKFRGMRFAGLGMEFAAAVAGLTLLGLWIDRRFDTEPWGVLVGAGVGIIGGMYNMIRQALATSQPKRQSPKGGADEDQPTESP